MLPLPGETPLIESDGAAFVLTTHRVRFRSQRVGRGDVQSLLLEELSIVELRFTSMPWLIAIAGFSLLGGVAAGQLLAGALVTLVCLIVYAASRHQVLQLTSSSGRAIALAMHGQSLRDTEQLIDQIEAAKNARFFQLAEAGALPLDVRIVGEGHRNPPMRAG